MSPSLLARAIAAPLLAALIAASCRQRHSSPTSPAGEDASVTTLGTIEVSARLPEIPEGAIFKRELYDYATILKYEVISVHRGELPAATIYVGHYNPFKPRRDAADRRVEGIGGNLESFAPGQVHRMALEAPIEDFFMGGIINKYFGQHTEPIYWAVWTNLASD